MTVTPEGYRFRNQIFETLGGLLKWFKEHFRDPIPGTPLANTPRSVLNATPYNNPQTPYNRQTPMIGMNFICETD